MMMSCVKFFVILLLINATWKVNGEWTSKGYKDKGVAEYVCGPREMYMKDNRYHCYSVSETVLNEYERQFGKEERLKINTQEGYENLINTIQDNSLCEPEPFDLLFLLFPNNYEKYLAVGKVVQKISKVSPHCDYMSKVRGKILTSYKLEMKIQELLDNGICEKVKKAEENKGSKTEDPENLEAITKVLKKKQYCGFKEPLGKRICRKLFGIFWLPCALAHLFGADVLNTN